MKKEKIKEINIIIFCIIISPIISIIILLLIGNKLKNNMMEISKFEINKIESTIVNKAINELLNEGYDTNNIFATHISENKTIETIDFNSNQVNRLLSILTMKIQADLKMLDEGMIEDLGINDRNISLNKNINLRKGVLMEIPIGALTNNMFLTELGTRIPIKLHFLGDVNSNISTKIREYGINNALMEIYANIEINARVILPFLSEKITTTTSVPLAIKMIQGKVPNYYGNSLVKDSQLYSLPLE